MSLEVRLKKGVEDKDLTRMERRIVQYLADYGEYGKPYDVYELAGALNYQWQSVINGTHRLPELIDNIVIDKPESKGRGFKKQFTILDGATCSSDAHTSGASAPNVASDADPSPGVSAQAQHDSVSLESIVAKYKDLDFSPTESPINSPVVVKTMSGTGANIGVINGVYAGASNDVVAARNALKFFEAKQADCVIITGDTFYIDDKVAGKYSMDRARMSGTITDPECVRLPDAVDINVAERLADHEPVYTRFTDKLNSIIKNNLKPIFLNEEGQPLYSGNVYIVFGKFEEMLQRRNVRDYLRLKRDINREIVQEKISDLKAQKKQVDKMVEKYVNQMIKDGVIDIDKSSTQNLEEVVEKQMEGAKGLHAVEYKRLAKEACDLEKQILDWTEYKSDITMTNTNDEFKQYVANIMERFIIETLENAIPNSKVISTGEGHLQVNDQLVRVTNDPRKNKGNFEPADNNLASLARRINDELSGGAVKVPDIVLAGGPNSTYSALRVGYEGVCGKDTILFCVVPTCLNKEKIQYESSKKVSTKDDFSKLATMPDFNTGALMLKINKGIVTQQVLTDKYLNNNDLFAHKESINGYKLMYGLVLSDQHQGSPFETLVRFPDRPRNIEEAMQMIFKRIDAPFLMCMNLGDDNQDKNYPTEMELHPDYKTARELFDLMTEIERKHAGDPAMALEMIKYIVTEDRFRLGITPPFKQREEKIEKVIDYEFYMKLYERCMRMNARGPYDIMIDGNHSQHTSFGMFPTAVAIAEAKRLTLGVGKDVVDAPMLGTMGYYQGVYGLGPKPGPDANAYSTDELAGNPSLFPYFIYAQHKIGTSKSADPTRPGAAKVRNMGGNNRLKIGRFQLYFAGDSHTGGWRFTNNGILIKGYCHQDSNEFGARFNFGPAIEGVRVLGIPENVSEGPIYMTDYCLKNLQDIVDGKVKDDELMQMFSHSVTERK